MSLHDELGRAALAAAMAEPDPSSLAAATRLRRVFAPELAAEALAQAVLRRKARAKFGADAADLFVTAHGLEQATRPEVSAWRAQRMVEAGITRVVDLGCGIGADSLAFLSAGLEVVAVELDETTAEHARANLASVRLADGQAHPHVLTGDAVAMAPELLAGSNPQTCVFVDPARRTDAGRTWRVDQFTPAWDFVTGMLAGPHSCVVKLGPGVPRELVPDGVECDFVSHRGDVVEAGLWRVPGAEPGECAVVLRPEGEPLAVRSRGQELPVAPMGRYLHEPNGAVIRARALDAIDDRCWLLDPEIAYLSSDEPLDSPLVSSFEVLDETDVHERTLRGWVREHDIGTLEIKKRGLDLDPAELRRRLKPKGTREITLVLGRTPAGARAWWSRRMP